MRNVYQCDVCGVVYADKARMEKHEGIPVTGPIVEPGEVYGFNRGNLDYTPTIFKGVEGLQVAVGLESKVDTRKHELDVRFLLYDIGTAGEVFLHDEFCEAIRRRNSPGSVSRALEELSEEQFRHAVGCFGKSTLRGGKSVMSYIMEHFAKGTELRRGVLEKPGD